MTSSTVLASGTPGGALVASGKVLEWHDSLLDNPSPLRGTVVYDRGPTPLFRAAFIAEHGAAALLMAEGGKNYHPLILATEAGLPTVAGIGSSHDWVGEIVTVDAGTGKVIAGADVSPPTSSEVPAISAVANAPDVYVNVGYPAGLTAAAESGAAGLGLMRTEFAAVRTLALNLRQPLDDGRSWHTLLEQVGNEADALYAIAIDDRSKDSLRQGLQEVVSETVQRFGSREVIIRTLDIARQLDEPMGNRGIRRCVGSGGATIRLLCEAIRDVIDEQGGQIGLILPLVSHYDQIKSTVEILLDCGLNLQRPGSTAPRQINFGWEIEQPAAAQNNRLWLAAYKAEFGQAPHMIGIGTNDLTQFTIALGRDVYTEETDPAMADYLRTLYDEHEFSVVRQIVESAAQCRQAGTRVFLLGQAGADPLLAPLLFACGITPSVSAAKVSAVQSLAVETLESGFAERAIRSYQEQVLATYPESARAAVNNELIEFFTAHNRH